MPTAAAERGPDATLSFRKKGFPAEWKRCARPQCVLRPEEGPLAPLLHFGDRQPMFSGGRLRRRLALEDAYHQRRTPLGRPPLRRLRALVRHGPVLARDLITVVLVDLQ
jgi:hypothetical protein